jgi:hypothetical protein
MNGLVDVECDSLIVSNVLETDEQSLGLDYIYGFSQPANIEIGTGITPTTIFSCYGSPNTSATYNLQITSPFSISESGNVGMVSFETSPTNVNVDAVFGTVYSFIASADNMKINLACKIPVSVNLTANNQAWGSGNTIFYTTITSIAVNVYKDGVLYSSQEGTANASIGVGVESYSANATSSNVINYDAYILTITNSLVINHVANGNTAFYEVKVKMNALRSNSRGLITTDYIYANTSNTGTLVKSASITGFNAYPTAIPTFIGKSYSPQFMYKSYNKINNPMNVKIFRNGGQISSSNYTLNANGVLSYDYIMISSLYSFSYNQFISTPVFNLTLNHENFNTTSFYEVKVSFPSITRTQDPVINSQFKYIFNTTQATPTTKTANVQQFTDDRTGFVAKTYTSTLTTGTIEFYNGTGSILENELIVNRVLTQMYFSKPYYISVSLYVVPVFTAGVYPSNTYFINYNGNVEIFLTKMSDIYIGLILYFRKIAPMTEARTVKFTASLNCRIFDHPKSTTHVSTLNGATNNSVIYTGNGDWNFMYII